MPPKKYLRTNLILFLLFIAAIAKPVIAQETATSTTTPTPQAVTMVLTIFRDADSLTIYVPRRQEYSSLTGLTLRVTTSTGEQINKRLDTDFLAFLGMPFHDLAMLTPVCFRLVRSGTNAPAPQACQGTTLNLTEFLFAGDVFWRDSAASQDRLVLLLKDGQPLGVCPPGQAQCEISFVLLLPTPTPTATMTDTPESTSTLAPTETPTATIEPTAMPGPNTLVLTIPAASQSAVDVPMITITNSLSPNADRFVPLEVIDSSNVFRVMPLQLLEDTGYVHWIFPMSDQVHFLAGDGTIWDVEKASHTVFYEYINTTAEAYDENHGLLAFGEPGGPIKLWDLASNQEYHKMRSPDGWDVYSLAFSSNGDRLFGTVNLPYDTSHKITIWDVATGRRVSEIDLQVYGVYVDLAINKENMAAVAVTEKGQSLPIGGVSLWDMETETKQADLFSGGSYANALAFSPDGALLPTGHGDGTIRLWDVESATEFATLRGHEDAVSSVTFSPDGNLLASLGIDLTLRFWSVKSSEELVTITVPGDDIRGFDQVHFISNGMRLLVTQFSEGVQIYGVPKTT